MPYDFSNKIGFDAPRFWEKQQIYGGISFVGGETSLVWYPSNGLHTARGMLLACYGSGPHAKGFAERPLEEQIAIARGRGRPAAPRPRGRAVQPGGRELEQDPVQPGALAGLGRSAAGRRATWTIRPTAC